jgi:hypothetical protein
MRKKLAQLAYKHLKPEIKEIEATITKRTWMDNARFAFEMEGKRFFAFNKATDLPINRYEAQQVILIQLENRLTNKELKNLLEIAEIAADNAFNALKNNEKVKNIGALLASVKEINSRNEVLMFHPKLLCELAALSLIREDEDCTVINKEIHKEKVDLFMRQGGSADFFTKTGVISLFPNPELLLQKSAELWEAHIQQLANSKKTFDTIHGEISATHG